jgi:hypothetical protein
MALKGFFTTDSYSVLHLKEYDKHNQFIRCEVVTYRDDTKRDKISTQSYSWYVGIHSDVNHLNLVSLPDPLVAGNAWVVSDNPDEHLKDYKKMIVSCKIDGKWSLITPGKGMLIKDLSTGDWLEWSGTTWVTVNYNGFTEDTWNSLFGVNVIELDGNNEIKACYEHLKTMPGWTHTVDA